MGKHFKEEEVIEVKAKIAADDYYRARIKQLEAENMGLNREIEALENKEELLHGCIAELKSDIEELLQKNSALEKAVLRSALREVE